MNAAPHDEIAKSRVTAVLAALGDTVGIDATIGRVEPESGVDEAELPRISMDPSALGGRASDEPGSAPRRADLQLVGLLGEGGMGAVYAARQRALDREVAVKRLRSADATEQARRCLLAEARVMGALEHPNIVPVHALGCDESGLPVLVMKRVEGVSWRALLEDPNHPMWSELGGARDRGLPLHLRVMVSVCDALRFAHDRGVIHRDIKPENVMVGAFGEVYLLDWGVARHLADAGDAQVVGTPGYMAPEMVADPASADVRTDVYLLGAVLHEILTGDVLHRGHSLGELLMGVMLAQPRERADYTDSLPSLLVDLCIAATHPDRSNRPASVDVFRESLSEYAAHRASQEIAASALEKLEEAERRVGELEVALTESDVGVLLAESRFGLEQSLRQWSENVVARAGLQRCLERSCERELTLRNVSAARALLATLPEPRPSLATRLDQLERELDDARNAEREHARLAREMDSSVSALPRLLFLGAFLLFGTGLSISAYLEEQRTGHMMSFEEQMQLDGSIVAFLTVGLFLARRRLLTNTFNRVTWALWYISVVAITISDAYLGHIGVDSSGATPLGFGLVALVFTVGAVAVNRSLGLVALPLWAASVAAATHPPTATLSATIGIFVAVAVNMELTRRVAKRAAVA